METYVATTLHYHVRNSVSKPTLSSDELVTAWLLHPAPEVYKQAILGLPERNDVAVIAESLASRSLWWQTGVLYQKLAEMDIARAHSSLSATLQKAMHAFEQVNLLNIREHDADALARRFRCAMVSGFFSPHILMVCA